jgi:twitching motility protein PilT
VVFRLIPQDIPALAALGAPPAVEKLTALQKGLVLVTGPTGSGKSTTLAALIDHINTTSARHVLTIEDPIEFMHRSKRSLINQREIGRDSRSFARALRSALREDPDVILVGELRDLETIGLALTAAETGHLVLGTLHTTSAAKTIDRLIDVFPSADKAMVRTMLSGSLRAVIAQTLLRRPDGAGRVAAFEVLVGTPAVANLIRENQISQINAMMQTGARYGMQLMTDAIQALVAMGLVDAAEAARGASAWTGEGQSGRSSLAVDLASAAGVGPAQPAGPRLATPRAAEPEYAF